MFERRLETQMQMKNMIDNQGNTEYCSQACKMYHVKHDVCYVFILNLAYYT